MAISKVKLPDNTTQDIKDSRIAGVDSTPTANSQNVVTSGGIKEYVDGSIPTALSDLTDDVVSGNYLPLSGGTVSGNIVISGQTNCLKVSNGSNKMSILKGDTLSLGSTIVLKPTGGTDVFGAYNIEFQNKQGTVALTSDIPVLYDWAKASTKPTYTASEVGALPDTTVIPTVPTISTNVVSDKTSDTKTSSPKSVYDEIHPAVVTTQPSGGFAPNVLYRLGTLTGSVTFTLATPSDNTIVNHYYLTFTAGSTAPTITWPSGLTWVGGNAPEINGGSHYEISILDGIAAYIEA